MADISERLKELRKESGLSYRKIAKETKLNASALYRWEVGIYKPDADAIIVLANFFGVSADYLLGLSDY